MKKRNYLQVHPNKKSKMNINLKIDNFWHRILKNLHSFDIDKHQ